MSKAQGYVKPVMVAKKAGADLSALQYSFVKYGSDPETIIGCGDNDIPLGVLMNAPVSGDLAEVVVEGGAKIKCSGSVGLNASVGSAASGAGKAITSGAASAIAMKDGVDGEIIPILVDRHTGRSA